MDETHQIRDRFGSRIHAFDNASKFLTQFVIGNAACRVPPIDPAR
jgi:hypothetical protein